MLRDLFNSNLCVKTRIIAAIKIVVAFMFGILGAELFRLDYAYTAGVIAVIGLDQTRKRSVQAAIIWLLDSFLALGIASLLFHFLGYQFWVLIVFIAILVPLSYLLALQNGIVVAIVLISQIYGEQDLSYGFNALYILLIGIAVAFLLNLYMPKVDRQIDIAIKKIDTEIDRLLQAIAAGETASFVNVKALIKQTQEKLYLDIENHYFVQTNRRIRYLDMRLGQLIIMERIGPLLGQIAPIPEKDIIVDFIKTFKGKIGTSNFALSLKHELDALFEYFRQAPLPKEREEFEQRAQLYYILREIDSFLILKIKYHESN